MIVVDSSVWIGILRGAGSGPVGKLRGFLEMDDDRILVVDPVLLEVLQGACDEAHASRVEREMRRIPVAPMLGDSLAVQAARTYRDLRGHGITARKTVGMIIGTFCIEGWPSPAASRPRLRFNGTAHRLAGRPTALGLTHNPP